MAVPVRVSQVLVDEVVVYLGRDEVRSRNHGFVRPSNISRELRRSVTAVDGALRRAQEQGLVERQAITSDKGRRIGVEYRAVDDAQALLGNG